MSSAIVRLEGVSRSYGTGARAVAALTDVTLDVEPGALLAVTGPSGSGKSTLLTLIAGLDTPTAGRVVLAGHDLAGLSDDARSDLRLRHVGFVFQAFNLFPAFTAEENVAWPAVFLGVAWREARRRAATMLSRVGIEAGGRDRRPGELSGGEQQRVAIARALVTEPQLLLADEPTGNLDSGTASAMLELLVQLNAERGLTVIMATHNPAAARCAHRVAELHDGRLTGMSRPAGSSEPGRRMA